MPPQNSVNFQASSNHFDVIYRKWQVNFLYIALLYFEIFDKPIVIVYIVNARV